jgi:molecular chaperone GrpE
MHLDDSHPHPTAGARRDEAPDDLSVEELSIDPKGETAANPGLPDPTIRGRVERWNEVEQRLDGVASELAELVRRLDAETERAASRERVIERQHEEIERLRSVERAGSMRPVITDLCRLRNDLLRQAATMPLETTGERFTGLLGSFAASVEEALERCGVEILPREIGSRFVAGRQQVAAVVAVHDVERDGTVAEILQDGYAEIDGGKIILPARITLHRLAAADTTRDHENATKENSDG